MNNYARSFSGLVSVLVLTFTLTFSFAYLAPGNRLRAVAAQSTALSGSFGFLLNAWSSPTSNNPGTAILGVMNFDGMGNVTGTATVEVGADNAKPPQTVAGTFTGTYSTNPDGTGSMTITLNVGFIFPFTMVIADGGQSLQLVATNCSGGCDLGGLVISGSARTAYAGSPKGSYAFQFSNSPEPVGSVGVAKFDGAGNVAVSLTVVAAPHGGGPPPMFSGTLPGTYSVNPDGSGAINLKGAPGQSPDSAYSFVITDGGAGLLLMQTAGRPDSDTSVSFGTARLQ